MLVNSAENIPLDRKHTADFIFPRKKSRIAVSEHASDDYSSDVVESVNSELSPRKKKKVTFFSLFRYANGLDITLLVIGMMCSVFNGATFQVYLIVLACVTDAFVAPNAGATVVTEMKRLTIYNSILGFATLVIAYVEVF